MIAITQAISFRSDDAVIIRAYSVIDILYSVSMIKMPSNSV